MRFRTWPVIWIGLGGSLAVLALGMLMRMAGVDLGLEKMIPGRQHPEVGPSLQPSDEANERQLNLAREQGKTFQRAVDEMIKKEAHGEEQRAGDYLIGYAVEKAEGMYQLREGQLDWVEPQKANAHIEIVVRDAADGRFVPDLNVHATLIDANGQYIGTQRQVFIWHPWLYHYGRNWQVPGDGEYTLRVRVEEPAFPRHDKVNGKRFSEPVETEFKKVMIKTGQKKS